MSGQMNFSEDPAASALENCCGRVIAVLHSAPQKQFCIRLQGTFFCFAGAT